MSAPRKWGLLSGPMVVDCAHGKEGATWPPPSICRFTNARGETLPNAEANARLISAAPDLLAALEGMVSGFKLTQRPESYPADHPINMALAAIAKARKEEGQ